MGVNLIILLLSIIALVVVLCRRFELFSCTYLVLYMAVGILLLVLQLETIGEMAQVKDVYTGYGWINEHIWSSIFVQIISIPMYATVHNLFSLQYLRASLTVPLYYERQIQKDSNAAHKLPALDKKISIRKWAIILAQSLLFTVGLSATLYLAVGWSL